MLAPGLVALALLSAARPVPASLGIDALPLVALAIVDAMPDPCPADMVLVDGEFCPDMHYECERQGPEEEAFRCRDYVRKSACDYPTEPKRYCVDRYEWPNKPGENPTVNVSWYEARRSCEAVGKRLCQRSEWMLACEGPKRLPYPYGFVRQPSPCNVDRRALRVDTDAWSDDATRDAETARLWQGDPSGAHPSCVSSWGAFDMTGNVDEWTDNMKDNPSSKHISTLNGGYWGPVRDTCRLTTVSHGPSFRFYQIGFRCCADAADGLPNPAPVAHTLADR